VTVFVPRQVSEREPGGWEDCVWCTGVMLHCSVHGRNLVPNTRAEYEALRVAGGDGPREKPGDGSNHQQLVDGIRRRYDWVPSRLGPPGSAHVPWSTVLAHLDTPGDVVALQGSMGVWSRTSHWRRWDPQFDGPHDVLVTRRDRYSRLWWQNPQAPNEYPGEWISLTEARRYYEGFAGGIIFDRVGRLAPVNFRVFIEPGARLRLYTLDGQCIESWKDLPNWGRKASSAPALQKHRRETCDERSHATTAYVTDGPLKGHLRIGAAYGVEHKEV
jgi:hypothetical protein